MSIILFKSFNAYSEAEMLAGQEQKAVLIAYYDSVAGVIHITKNRINELKVCSVSKWNETVDTAMGYYS